MVRAFGTAGVTLSMLAAASSCTTSGQTYAPPPPAETIVASGSRAPTQWPLRLDTASGQIAVYQPQPETFEGDKLTARAAVSMTPPGATDPVFGALWVHARVATDRDSRTVTILDAEVKRVRFPDSDDAQQQQFARTIEQEFPRMNVTFSLDELSTSLEVVEKEKVAAEQLQTAPPKIVVTNIPSTLVMIDGDPKLQPVEQTRLMRVVNTPFIVLLDMDSKRYFLKAGEPWFTATDIKGPWGITGTVPASVADEAIKLAPPPAPADAAGSPPGAAPAPLPPPPPQQVIVATEPTEMISTNGAPTYSPLPGNELLYISNTQSDVFLEIGTQENYVLLSGRWYRTRSLQGPWEFVAADKLPASFANIPANSPKGNVLASIAGTAEAKDARYDAAIPQTAVVRRTGGEPLTVAYDGQPQFVSIQDSPVQYAVNTPESVLTVDGRYYCCHQAVWYESAVAAGPWGICVSVPRPIYLIPPSCPVYHVRYCYVYDYTPDVVYCGYVSGYTGSYVYGPTVVYGTGYYYGGWYGTTYYARPWTWGCGVRYDPIVAIWGFGAPYGWDRRWMVRDNDRYDHSWWGPRGYVGYRGLSRDTRYAQARDSRVNVNIYNRTVNVTRNVTINRNFSRDTTINRNEVARGDTSGRRSGYSPPTAGNPSTYQNNVYAGHDGQVYRRTDTGWEQRGNGGWQKLNNVPEAAQGERAGRGENGAARDRAGNGTDRGATVDRGNAADRGSGAASPRRDLPEETRKGAADRPANVRGGGGSPPGLEADHVARQRGEQRSRSEGDASRGDSGAGRNSGGGKGDSGGGGGRNAGGNGGGGNGGGGGGGGGGGNGGNNKGK